MVYRTSFVRLRSEYVGGHSEVTPPLDIIATTDEHGWHFALSPESKARLDSVLKEEGSVSVTVPFDVADDFRRLYGELYPFVVEWVTHSSKDELARLGGVRVLHGNDCVWKWPH